MWSGVEWSVSGKRKSRSASERKGVLSSIFTIFKSLGLQYLTFSTTVLDCLQEELSGTHHYFLFRRSNFILNFRSVSVPANACKKEFF